MSKTSKGCKYDTPQYLKLGIVLCDTEPEYKGYCLEHLPYLLKLEYEHDQIPQETRQKYLDLIHEGKTIGEAKDAVGISLEGALEITNRSIENFKYLGKVAK